MAQDVVRRRGVEIHVRDGELQQVVGSRKYMGLAANGPGDLAGRGVGERVHVEPLQILDRARDARDEVIEALLLVLVRRRLCAG